MVIEDILPSREAAFELLKKLKVPYQVRRHSLKVAEKALEIAYKIKKVEVNFELVEIGAIMHDIGRGLDKEDAKFLNLPEKDYIPESLEEKIICLADKHTAGTKDVSIEQRFQKWFLKYGKTEILMKSKRRIEKIQEELQNLM
jgi:putative nucleotidyltransferase with HDIG domain